MTDAPIASEGFFVTHFFTVRDQEKSICASPTATLSRSANIPNRRENTSKRSPAEFQIASHRQRWWHAAHKSMTTSLLGCEQQTRTLPSAGMSSGSGS